MSFMRACRAFIKAWREPEVQELALQKSTDTSHLRLLSMLQNAARLIDFLKEDLAAYSDAEVGGVARQVHADSRKWLEDYITARPLLAEEEGASITVPVGYDPNAIKVIGKIKGAPPFKGIVRHRGWKAHKLSLPKAVGEQNYEVLCSAEVEVQ